MNIHTGTRVHTQSRSFPGRGVYTQAPMCTHNPGASQVMVYTPRHPCAHTIQELHGEGQGFGESEALTPSALALWVQVR